MTRSKSWWDYWALGPTTKPGVLCQFLGTNFCRDWCPDWDEVATNCTLSKCQVCPNSAYCQCTINRLPRPIPLHIHLPLPPPNGSTHFDAHAQGKVSQYHPESQWLLLDPRWSAQQTINFFTEKYGTHPPYHLYVTSLGILIAGPLPVVVITP